MHQLRVPWEVPTPIAHHKVCPLRGLKSGLSVTSLGDKRPIRALILFKLQRNLRANMCRTGRWATRRSQPVLVDRLVLYPLVFIHLRHQVVKVVRVAKLVHIYKCNTPYCAIFGAPIQGFKHFSGFLHHFLLAKLATSSKRVNDV